MEDTISSLIIILYGIKRNVKILYTMNVLEDSAGSIVLYYLLVSDIRTISKYTLRLQARLQLRQMGRTTLFSYICSYYNYSIKIV